MEKTTHYNLNKPSQDDFYDVNDFNANADIVDRELKANAEAIASKKGLDLGETETTAYRGDRGKVAYDHTLEEGNPHNLPIDTELSLTSENPVQNKAVAIALSNSGNTTTKQFKAITIPTASWTADATFADYPHKTDISVEGIAQDWNCISLTPDHTDRALDMLCPYAYTGEGKITIWIDTVPSHDVTIENIIFQKAVI